MRAFGKSALRQVMSAKLRFLAIALIVFLGAGIFAGLLAVSPNMKRAGDEFFDQKNLSDVHLRSTYGFDKDDLKALSQVEGVEDVQTVNLFDAVGVIGGADYTLQLNSLEATLGAAPTNLQNKLTLEEGHWPRKENEAVLIRPSLGAPGIHLGDSATLKLEERTHDTDLIRRSNYKIVGFATTPEYLFFFGSAKCSVFF